MRNPVEQMTRVGDICTVLQDMDNELQQLYRQLEKSSPEIDPQAIESIIDGSAYLIGLKDRSEDAIPSIPGWVEKRQTDDAIKVCAALSLNGHI